MIWGTSIVASLNRPSGGCWFQLLVTPLEHGKLCYFHRTLKPTLSSPVLMAGPTVYLTCRFSLAQIHWTIQKEKQNSTFEHSGVGHLITKPLSHFGGRYKALVQAHVPLFLRGRLFPLVIIGLWSSGEMKSDVAHILPWDTWATEVLMSWEWGVDG